jgi:two-component system OmpR family response regulator
VCNARYVYDDLSPLATYAAIAEQPVAQTILIVDDDPHILEVIGFALERAGFATISAHDGLSAVSRHAETQPDLIILDINLPELDGLDVCREIRKTSDVPILFLSSRDEEIDRIVGLEIGGDDYVSKPFSPRELVARAKVILKRGRTVTPEGDDAVLTVNDVTLWLGQHRVCYRDAEVSLTATEFRVLKAFLARPQLVRDRQAIIDVAYDINIHVSDRTVDSHIRHIRAKFQETGCDSIIETVHGVGYKLGACR